MRLARLAIVALALAAPLHAETVEHPGVISPTALGYLDSDGSTFVPITIARPLPIAGALSARCTAVEAGDQAWTAGGSYDLPCSRTGRLRVGLSSAAQEGGVLALYSDLTGARGVDGLQHALLLDALLRLMVDDPQNASFTFAPAGGAADSSSAAAYSFTASSQAAARGWYANCPAGTAITVTLIGVNGGTAPRTLYDGWQADSDRLAGFSGNAGCTIGERF